MSGAGEQTRTPTGRGSQSCGPLERCCGAGMSAAFERPVGGALERNRRWFIVANGGGREVPCAPLKIVIGQHCGK